MFSKLIKRPRRDDRALTEGRLAFSNGIDISENPYPNSDRNLASSWESGWKEAEKGRKSFEKKHTWPQSEAQPTNHTLPSYANLDAHVQRFIEINEAIDEIRTIFEVVGARTASVGSETDPLEQIMKTANEVRIPGFFAYHLAQEALSLLNMIAASAALAKKDVGVSEKMIAALNQIEESEPMLHQTVYEMEPYKSMVAQEAIQIIAARASESKGE